MFSRAICYLWCLDWGNVTPFSLTSEDSQVYSRGEHRYRVYLDPGAPPILGGGAESSAEFRAGFEQVIQRSSRLDPKDGLIIDISPASRGNNTLGTNDGIGHAINPVTGKPYQPQWVFAGDYYRVLAEF